MLTAWTPCSGGSMRRGSGSTWTASPTQISIQRVRRRDGESASQSAAALRRVVRAHVGAGEQLALGSVGDRLRGRRWEARCGAARCSTAGPLGIATKRRLAATSRGAAALPRPPPWTRPPATPRQTGPGPTSGALDQMGSSSQRSSVIGSHSNARVERSVSASGRPPYAPFSHMPRIRFQVRSPDSGYFMS